MLSNIWVMFVRQASPTLALLSQHTIPVFPPHCREAWKYPKVRDKLKVWPEKGLTELIIMMGLDALHWFEIPFYTVAVNLPAGLFFPLGLVFKEQRLQPLPPLLWLPAPAHPCANQHHQEDKEAESQHLFMRSKLPLIHSHDLEAEWKR